MLAVSATTTASVERTRHRPLLLQDRRHKMTEEDLRKEVFREAVVLQEGDVKEGTEIILKETVQIHRAIIDIFP